MSPTCAATLIRLREEGFKWVGQQTTGLAICPKTCHLYESYGTATDILILPVFACIIPNKEQIARSTPVTVEDISAICKKLDESIMANPPMFGDFVEWGFWVDERGVLKVGLGKLVKLITQPSYLCIVRPVDA